MAESAKSDLHREMVRLLVEARKRAGLSQRQLALRLGKPQSFVAKYEAMGRKLDTGEYVGAAHHLGVEVEVRSPGSPPWTSSDWFGAGNGSLLQLSASLAKERHFASELVPLREAILSLTLERMLSYQSFCKAMEGLTPNAIRAQMRRGVRHDGIERLLGNLDQGLLRRSEAYAKLVSDAEQAANAAEAE